MPILDPRSLRVSAIFLAGGLFLSCYPGLVLSAVVTLDSIEIYNTHELLKAVKPDVYFACKGENRTDLPDVKKANESYKFRGQESWQPLTELSEKKCKRCGFYEKDIFSDDVFDEWEFCPSEFTSDGKYIRFREKEVNATFSCSQCIPFAHASKSTSDSQKGGKGVHVALIILISVVVSTVLILGLLAAYKYWQKKKREQDQARFLKLFEDGDDIEDELGLGM
ncbi:valine-tRNA ligase [Parasponia andersonii]|uniref:Valine-tRNA ligase n=1 Tax=Parasponia andersonii TaxID=3476 RepID=A0A2P5DHQ6_PARAD|nr:valine-tRNA ligase [Parasponia andersonii]